MWACIQVYAPLLYTSLSPTTGRSAPLRGGGAPPSGGCPGKSSTLLCCDRLWNQGGLCRGRGGPCRGRAMQGRAGGPSLDLIHIKLHVFLNTCAPSCKPFQTSYPLRPLFFLPRPVPFLQVFLLSSGKLLTDLPDLHPRPITALLFFRPLKLLITAAKDGASEHSKNSMPILGPQIFRCYIFKFLLLAGNIHFPLVCIF